MLGFLVWKFWSVGRRGLFMAGGGSQKSVEDYIGENGMFVI